MQPMAQRRSNWRKMYLRHRAASDIGDHFAANTVTFPDMNSHTILVKAFSL
jgi:hypothetical protein